MRLSAFLLSFVVLVSATGCCCCPNVNKSGDSLNSALSSPVDDEDSTKKSSKSFSPIEYSIKARKMQMKLQELAQKQMDPNATDEELAEAQEEMDRLQNEMQEMQDNLMDSDFVKNSNNPMLKQAMSKMKESRKRHEEVMENQQRIMEQVQNMEEGFSESFDGSSALDDDFGTDIEYMDDPDGEIVDDVHMPDNF